MKWLVTAFLATVCAVFSFNALIGNDLSKSKSSNKLIAMLTDGYAWLTEVIGFIPTAMLFALCGVAIIVSAVLDKPRTPKVL